MPGILLLGLGPGDPAKLTREAWEVLSSADEIWLRTAHHPAVKGLPGHLQIHSFDSFYEQGETFEEVYQAIVEHVLTLGQRPQGVLYAVPGDPFVAEATTTELALRAREQRIPLRVVHGLSFLEPVFSALGVDPYPRLFLMDAIELSQRQVPAFPPDVPVLIAQIYSRLVAAEVKMTLNTVYPDEHPVYLVHAAGSPEEHTEALHLYEIDRSTRIGTMTALYVPPLGEYTSFEAFQEIVARLRAPDGCPWDREQTHRSLRSHLLEEAYEALDAIDAEEPAKLQEELGDLLLQIVLHAQIAFEEGDFTMANVLEQVSRKIIRRHPHVFGDAEIRDVQGVLKNWEKLKQAERTESGQGERSALDGVPLSLPSLLQAQEYQERAARLGFDWPEVQGVLEKVVEEVREIQHVQNDEDFANELGDLLFSLVNLARWRKVNAEFALRAANQRFRERFAYIEAVARGQGRKLSEMTLEEMDQLWEEAKRYKPSTLFGNRQPD
ncbi:MAG: nucleoside triphosphate pyrophosphohydrolase [Anaerolineales bacterium]|nr:nucleoside triphosphate pyrophosphohydrolase [Anaerolineales bacterium]MCX7608867.1 nucleoside triphosphate pyrophosphohydrolase [Anaerolineales bacterium]MDW8226292.1 nucleoside triphosphate pyrophosphohydrolase [Anaerolineales bacterium]